MQKFPLDRVGISPTTLTLHGLVDSQSHTAGAAEFFINGADFGVQYFYFVERAMVGAENHIPQQTWMCPFFP